MHNETPRKNASTPSHNTSQDPPMRVVRRKIGKSTFIVTSRFNNNKQKDIVSTIARLIEDDSMSA